MRSPLRRSPSSLILHLPTAVAAIARMGIEATALAAFLSAVVLWADALMGRV